MLAATTASNHKSTRVNGFWADSKRCFADPMLRTRPAATGPSMFCQSVFRSNIYILKFILKNVHLLSTNAVFETLGNEKHCFLKRWKSTPETNAGNQGHQSALIPVSQSVVRELDCSEVSVLICVAFCVKDVAPWRWPISFLIRELRRGASPDAAALPVFA